MIAASVPVPTQRRLNAPGCRGAAGILVVENFLSARELETLTNNGKGLFPEREDGGTAPNPGQTGYNNHVRHLPRPTNICSLLDFNPPVSPAAQAEHSRCRPGVWHGVWRSFWTWGLTGSSRWSRGGIAVR